MSSDVEFWKIRSRKYDNLEWVGKNNIIKSLLALGNFKPSDKVLEVGCGTGKVICAIAKRVKEAHGIDICQEMIDKIVKEDYLNLKVKIGDVRNIEYPDNSFDKVIARLMLHHIIDDDDLLRAVRECYRILRPGGSMIISEGVPPHQRLKKDYEEIFKLKEKRRTFLPEDLKKLLLSAGFVDVKLNVEIDKQMSVNNWLRNSGNLDMQTIGKINNMHRNSSDLFKKHYNLKDLGDDILIDVKVIIAIGKKPLK